MMDQKYSAIFFMHCVLMICCCLAMKQTNIDTDRSALLALKAYITSDPHRILSRNWSSTGPSSSVCGWIGVQCSPLHQRVAGLNVSDMGLTGTIPPHLGNLSFLVSLDMSRNYFHGSVPGELSLLRRIRSVGLGYNNLTGTIPTWFGPELQVLKLHYNDFSGIIPASISNLSNLEVLVLQGNSLTGIIPEEIGNLNRLTNLNLQSNFLVGSIPSSIFNISSLQSFALTYNNLSGRLPDNICDHFPNLKGIYFSANQFDGEIPPSLSRCSQLQILSLSYNNFSGFIPKELGKLEMLESLTLGYNNLQGVIPREIGNLHSLEKFVIEQNRISGSIPKEIGNLTMLTQLLLASNHLTGPIPEEICNLQNLQYLFAGMNALNGDIPIGFFNLSTLIVIEFELNNLTGYLPSNIGYQLPNLQVLQLEANNINGVIPPSIVNCSKLFALAISANQFTGTIPNTLGNLEFLEELSLASNHFTSNPESLELDFLTPLSRCRSLNYLYLSENGLSGILPDSIGNLSTSLLDFELQMNQIKGPIPSSFGNLSSLIYVYLDDNQLTGAIPVTIQELKHLQVLSLARNNIGGTLDNICNLPNIGNLYLSENKLSGPIPDCFGNMTSLRNLNLSHNLLTSSIPTSIWKLRDLIVFQLASNSFNGTLPPEIGNLKSSISIDLSMNQISGAIPSTLGGLQNIQNLSLANNLLEGSIPESLGNMVSLTSLNLSHNNLSGLIPKSLEALRSLEFFDVSYNHLGGEIPSGGPFRNFTSKSFIDNEALCGETKFQVSPCKIKTNKKHRSHVKMVLLLVLIPLMIVVLVILGLTYYGLRYRRKSNVPNAEDVPVVPTTERISYYELLQATDRYSESNLLGSGGFGSVYKGTFKDGKVVAVKVFNLQLESSLKSFDAECEVFCNLRHRNLVKIISSCSNQDFKALVLEYMPNGSLESWLHSDHLFLNMLQRLNIVIDVAHALRYLHQEYSTPVIHCDLKPSNVLLDEDLVACVSDFGIAKFLGKDESIALTKTFATVGYIAPEYGREGVVSKACDVFSYGVLLMEVFAGRRPSDEMFVENKSLKSWVSDSTPNSVAEIVDQKLFQEDNERSDTKELTIGCVSMIMELAMKCVPESPKERLTIGAVVESLEKIKDKYATLHRGTYHS